jgi:hypothetical protein
VAVSSAAGTVVLRTAQQSAQASEQRHCRPGTFGLIARARSGFLRQMIMDAEEPSNQLSNDRD